MGGGGIPAARQSRCLIIPGAVQVAPGRLLTRRFVRRYKKIVNRIRAAAGRVQPVP